MIRSPSSSGEHSGPPASRHRLCTPGYIKPRPVKGFALKPGLRWSYTHGRFELVKHLGSPETRQTGSERSEYVHAGEKYVEYMARSEEKKDTKLSPGNRGGGGVTSALTFPFPAF